MRKINREIDKYLILEIIENEDLTITFHMNHIDTYVYIYNLEKDPNAIPITGNITGFEGWYTVNMEENKLSIIYAQ